MMFTGNAWGSGVCRAQAKSLVRDDFLVPTTAAHGNHPTITFRRLSMHAEFVTPLHSTIASFYYCTITVRSSCCEQRSVKEMCSMAKRFGVSTVPFVDKDLTRSIRHRRARARIGRNNLHQIPMYLRTPYLALGGSGLVGPSIQRISSLAHGRTVGPRAQQRATQSSCMLRRCVDKERAACQIIKVFI